MFAICGLASRTIRSCSWGKIFSPQKSRWVSFQASRPSSWLPAPRTWVGKWSRSCWVVTEVRPPASTSRMLCWDSWVVALVSCTPSPPEVWLKNVSSPQISYGVGCDTEATHEEFVL